jgi:hypothetical protein
LPYITDAARTASKVADQYYDPIFFPFLSRLAFHLFSGVMFGRKPDTADKETADASDLDFVGNAQTRFQNAGVIIAIPQEKTLQLESRLPTKLRAVHGFVTVLRTLDQVPKILLVISTKKKNIVQ